MTLDEFDDCIVGVCSRIGQDDIVAYSKNKILEKLMAEGLSEIDAVEHFEHNIIGGWVGDLTPCFIITPEEES